MVGSSPLTRGKPEMPAQYRALVGLIPAHAGKTTGRARPAGQRRAHPRSRGENRDGVIDRLSIGGSSPLTRGKLHAELLGEVDNGLIPAHAGKTEPAIHTRRRGRAHPRSRGENTATIRSYMRKGGSSPLTRGKLLADQDIPVEIGLIPAHAGKTCPRTRRASGAPAHPRSRGENASEVVGLDGIRGSSPLTRGKPTNSRVRRGSTRLIPAHAGKTMTQAAPGDLVWAHPRSRGENSAPASAVLIALGSSPLTRGKRPGQHAAGAPHGLIPAHAGKTRAAPAAQIFWRAHPRSRGENTWTPMPLLPWTGSSPLTRGKRQRDY